MEGKGSKGVARNLKQVVEEKIGHIGKGACTARGACMRKGANPPAPKKTQEVVKNLI
jgi:hypothetical protein